MGFGLHLSRGQRQQLHGLDLYRYIRKYTRKLQVRTYDGHRISLTSTFGPCL